MTSLLTTLRSVRIGQFSAFDTLGTVAIALLISRKFYLPPGAVLMTMPALSVVAHTLAGVNTPFTDIVRHGPNALVWQYWIASLAYWGYHLGMP